MKIALLAPVEERVPPLKYGGTELVVSNISEELVKHGHKVELFATGNSQTKATLRAIFPEPVRTDPSSDPSMKLRESYKYIAIGKAIEMLTNEDFDIVHNHIGWRILPFCHLFNFPVITTLHGPLDINYQQMVYDQYPDHPYISISNNQRKPLDHLNYIQTVYNGIDLKHFDYNDTPDDYVAFLGRMSPEKGPKEAIEFAKKTGVKLKMAAKIDTVDQAYFQKEIEPLIDDKQIFYIGEIGPEEKNKFLRKAIALIALIQWAEPFGLFIVEAMATGTPVIATKLGSVPELIRDSKTGFIVNDVDEAARKWKNINKINRLSCRQHVEKNFTVEKMVDGYEKVYERVIKDWNKRHRK